MTKYFGDIPRGKPITRPKVEPVTLDAEKRLVYEDRVQVPRLYVQWPTVGEKHDDRFALDVLGRDPHRPAHGAADQGAGLRPAGGGVGVGRSEHQRGRGRVHRDDHAAAGPHADRPRSRGRRDHRASSRRKGRRRRRSRRRLPGRSSRSCAASIESRQGARARRWRGLSTAIPATSRPSIRSRSSVTAADVKRVANKYLTEGRVVLSIVPTGQADQAAKPAKARR